MNSPPKISVYETPADLAQAAAEKFVSYSREPRREFISVSLAGCTTPKRVYELLGSEQFRNRVEWSQVHLFFGDERCVPPDHVDSNYAMVLTTLISRIEIPPVNVHRIVGEGDPNANAVSYENELRQFFAGESWPNFDLVLLGMGADGHTASLFPNSGALAETSRWAIAASSDQLPQQRITLTLPVLNHAQRVMFLVTGKEKAARLAQVVSGGTADAPLPAQLIRAGNGNDGSDVDDGAPRSLEWLVDRDAASLL